MPDMPKYASFYILSSTKPIEMWYTSYSIINMLVCTNLGEHKEHASQIHDKLVKCTEIYFITYFYICSIYQHMRAQKQVTYLVYNVIYGQCNR